MIRTLYSDPYITLEHDEERRLVRYVRNAEPYPSLEIVRSAHAEVRRLMPPGPDLRLLLDVRAAKARNDESFEGEITRALATFLPKFTANAILVKSAVGRLQTQRLARESGTGVAAVFSEEAEALRYLGVQD